MAGAIAIAVRHEEAERNATALEDATQTTGLLQIIITDVAVDSVKVKVYCTPDFKLWECKRLVHSTACVLIQSNGLGVPLQSISDTLKGYVSPRTCLHVPRALPHLPGHCPSSLVAARPPSSQPPHAPPWPNRPASCHPRNTRSWRTEPVFSCSATTAL